MDRRILHDKLSKLMENLNLKLLENKLYGTLPVNNYIIGKNAQLKLEETYTAINIKIDLFSHLTYVLENKPEGNGNLSLPDDEYSFASTKDSKTAKYFLKCSELDFNEDADIEKRLTIYTFEIQTQSAFRIKFKIPGFEHCIHLKAGTHGINTPYHQDTIENLIEIE